MPDCYLCGAHNASVPLSLPETFTAHNLARAPHSPVMCHFCNWILSLRCWYFNPHKKTWGKLFSRNWSSLMVGNNIVAPLISGSRTDGKTELPIVQNLPTRSQIRGWILNPPDPPFRIAIAESGQKHILPWAQPSQDKNFFPVQFELDCLWINRTQFAKLLADYEALLALGFSKSEIDSGNYYSDRLMQVFRSGYPWTDHDNQLQPYRGSRLLQLVSYLAQAPIQS